MSSFLDEIKDAEIFPAMKSRRNGQETVYQNPFLAAGMLQRAGYPSTVIDVCIIHGTLGAARMAAINGDKERSRQLHQGAMRYCAERGFYNFAADIARWLGLHGYAEACERRAKLQHRIHILSEESVYDPIRRSLERKMNEIQLPAL